MTTEAQDQTQEPSRDNHDVDPFAEGGNERETDSTFDRLVGEGRRYRSPEELARGKLEADKFIEQLTGETKELRAELDRRLAVEEALKRRQEGGSRGNAGSQEADDYGYIDDASGSDRGSNENDQEPENLDEKINTALERRLAAEREQKNKDTVKEMLTAEYGNLDHAAKAIRERASELNVSTQFLRDTATSSPEAFKRLMGVGEDTNEGGSAANKQPTSRVNSEALASGKGSLGGAREGTKAYYDQLRQENPRAYFSPKVQMQMFEDRKRLGDDFFK